MRSDYIRLYKSVHTWTGILSGMALFIAFYAGALTVFKEPLARWSAPPRLQALTPLGQANSLITQALAREPELAQRFVLRLHEGPEVAARLLWERREEAADDHDDSGLRRFGADLDAGGALRVQELQPSPLAGFIDVLHRVVGLPLDNDPNRWFMGLVSALYALALISGVVVLLPSLVKDFFALRLGKKNLKRMWLDAHNVVGIVSLPFHLVMALTAVVFAFHDQIYWVQDKLVHQGQWSSTMQRGGGGPPKAQAPRDPAQLLAPAALLERARAEAPGFEPDYLQYQQVLGPRAVVRVWGKHPEALAPRAQGGFVALDPYSGKLISRDYLPGGQDAPNTWISSFFALHMAAFGGSTVQWLYFLLGLAGAWLFYSGNLLWVETRRRRAAKDGTPPAQRRDTRLMAAATVGVCLGSVCGLSLMLAATRWLNGLTPALLAWHQALYYGAFFAALAWAAWRGAARAAVHLLWAAAALTAAIPAGSLLAWGLGRPWAQNPVLDLTALAGALALAWMARATARRVQQGAADSVWAAQAPSAAATPA